MRRAAVTEPAVLGNGDGLLEAGRAFRLHGNHDGSDLLGAETLYAPFDKTFRVSQVAVGTHQVLGAWIGDPGGDVDGCRLYSLGIRDQLDAGVCGGESLDDAGRIVCAASIYDEQLVSDVVRFRNDGCDGRGDIALFVQRGHDDAHKR